MAGYLENSLTRKIGPDFLRALGVTPDATRCGRRPGDVPFTLSRRAWNGASFLVIRAHGDGFWVDWYGELHGEHEGQQAVVQLVSTESVEELRFHLKMQLGPNRPRRRRRR